MNLGIIDNLQCVGLYTFHQVLQHDPFSGK